MSLGKIVIIKMRYSSEPRDFWKVMDFYLLLKILVVVSGKYSQKRLDSAKNKR